MEKDELISWIDKYNNEQDDWDIILEREFGEKFRQSGFVTKDDLTKIVKWKFQGRLIGRRNNILKHMTPISGSFIEDVSRLALKYEGEDEIRLKLLSCIKGVGFALSSVILSFYDPKNYGVLDIHAWRGLFRVEKEPRSIFTEMKYPLMFFKKIREISVETGLSSREVEKAYFMKDYIESTKT